jgi:hypothetical protein
VPNWTNELEQIKTLPPEKQNSALNMLERRVESDFKRLAPEGLCADVEITYKSTKQGNWIAVLQGGVAMASDLQNAWETQCESDDEDEVAEEVVSKTPDWLMELQESAKGTDRLEVLTAIFSKAEYRYAEWSKSLLNSAR